MPQLSIKVAQAAVSATQTMDAFATKATTTWNGRNVSKVNVTAALQYGVAQVARLINTLLVSLFANDILTHGNSSTGLKKQAALVLFTKFSETPQAAQVIARIFANLPEHVRNWVDGCIYRIDEAKDTARLQEAHVVGVPHYVHNTALDNLFYGRDLREGDPTNPTVKRALMATLRRGVVST